MLHLDAIDSLGINSRSLLTPRLAYHLFRLFLSTQSAFAKSLDLNELIESG